MEKVLSRVLLLLGTPGIITAAAVTSATAAPPLARLRMTRSACRASVQMSDFSPIDALRGTFERLTDFRVARASHILLKGFDDDTVTRMAAWKAELGDDPEAFAELAQASSQCPSRVKGETAPHSKSVAPSIVTAQALSCQCLRLMCMRVVARDHTRVWSQEGIWVSSLAARWSKSLTVLCSHRSLAMCTDQV